MPWWIKALFVGTIIATVCVAVGYLLSRVMIGDEWQFFAGAVLILVAVYLVASSLPRRLAPSHTRRSRNPVENAGLHQMAYHVAENPGDGARARNRFNPDFLIAAIPLLVAFVVIVILA
ncbi:MAG: hypothetical protein EA415_11865 [Sphaerobacteraceae bacterium]|nr:MAG: hypothetical protein EA415_11865 [Sphaerobacteraceae bacterium]